MITVITDDNDSDNYSICHLLLFLYVSVLDHKLRIKKMYTFNGQNID